MKVAKHEPTGEYLIVCSQREVDILCSVLGVSVGTDTKGKDTEPCLMYRAISPHRETMIVNTIYNTYTIED